MPGDLCKLAAAGGPEGLHDALGRAGSAIVLASLEDALGVVEQTNLPGTAGGDNWSLALPATLEEIERDARAAQVARALARHRT